MKLAKTLTLATVAAMLALGTAAAETYSVTANGYGGPMDVMTTIENGVITDVALGEQHETNVVIDRAFPVIRDRILSGNTADVDSVSGATFSSYAVKTAVADAMGQAGLDKPEVTLFGAQTLEAPTVLEAEHCDIVIVGGGPAGIAAAITAKETNPEAKIILVEKMDILSGNGKFDMNYFDLINSQAQKQAGTTRWTENQIENFLDYKKSAIDGEARVAVWAEKENNMDAWLRSMDVALNYNYGETNHMAEADQYAGEVIQAGMENRLFSLDVDVRTGTRGDDLVMEDKSCRGVVVTNNRNETYTIYAKSVILATGGYCANKELLAKYAPGYEVLNTSNQMGATGDFIPVFEKNGFQLGNMEKMSVFSNIIVPRRDLTGGADMNLLVNKEGVLLPNKSGLDRADMIAQQPSGAVFYITDKTGYDSFYRIRKHVGLGYYQQGETLADLAAALGIDAKAFEENVALFNQDAANGAEHAAIAAVPSRALDQNGPYYGVRVEAALHMTKGGVVANEKTQVLYEDGTVVPGLYAAGEVTEQQGGYSASVCFGQIAGEQAALAN